MTIKEKYKILDLLLVAFKDGSIASEISQNNNIDFHTVHSLSKDLVEKGFLTDYHEIANKKKEHYGNFVATTSQRGLYFLNVEGGFKRKHKQYILNRIWTITKIIAAVANALIIISVSIWAIIESKKNNKLEDRVIELEKIISDKQYMNEKSKNLENNIIKNK